MLPSVSYLGNGWTDCADIWCVVRDPLALRFTLLRGEVHLHVRTAFPYLRNGWTDCDEICYAVVDQLAGQLTQTKDGVRARAHLQMCPVYRTSEAA